MRRFGLMLDTETYTEFYRVFPDWGQRTSIVRKCIKRIVRRAKEEGYIENKVLEEIVDGAFEGERGETP